MHLKCQYTCTYNQILNNFMLNVLPNKICISGYVKNSILTTQFPWNSLRQICFGSWTCIFSPSSSAAISNKLHNKNYYHCPYFIWVQTRPKEFTEGGVCIHPSVLNPSLHSRRIAELVKGVTKIFKLHFVHLLLASF